MFQYLRPTVIGQAVRLKISDIGYATRLFFKLLLSFGATFRRGRLVGEQIHFLGNHSLAIIVVSGLFRVSQGLAGRWLR